jgi:hypothetical protein
MRTAKERKDEKKCGRGKIRVTKTPGLFTAYNTKLARSSHKPPATRKFRQSREHCGKYRLPCGGWWKSELDMQTRWR